jgi:hypothetical protein
MGSRIGEVSYDFLIGSVSEKCTYGRGMTEGLGGHLVRFPSPKIAIVDYDDATDLMETTDHNWQTNGGHPLLVLKNNAEKAWNIVAKAETYYVGGIAVNDEAIMIEGGCSITKTVTTPTHKPNPIISGWVERFEGTSGAIHMGSNHDKLVDVDGFCFIVGTGTFSIVNDQLVMGADAVIVGMKCDTHRNTDMTGLPIKTDLGVWIFSYNGKGCSVIAGPFPIFTL